MKATVPKQLGDFEIIREIGRGGMGVVYEARQRSLNRCVALKVLSSGLGLTAKAVQRFRREAEAAAKLHHTNIVPIYSTGNEHGVHFYAMELIDGPSLDHVIRHLRDGQLAGQAAPEAGSTVDSPPPGELPAWVSETMVYSPASAERPSAPDGQRSDASGSGISSHPRYYDHVASMMAEVADALQHAHDQGVIHRDIKPSNLLLSNDGRISLNDFGLARVLEQPGMTLSGEFVGSPLYMSPEQITAGRAPLDHRTDIYSLGATLYEALTLQPPYPGRQRDQIIAQILHKDVVPPRRKNRRIPVDLETICLKALEKDPDRRYQTAGQMADDLRCYVNRFAISARRAGPLGRAIKWTRRRPAIATLIALVLGMGIFAGGLSYQLHRMKAQMREQKIQHHTEQATVSAMEGDLDEAKRHIKEVEKLGSWPGQIRVLNGIVALYQGDFSDAIEHLDQAAELDPDSAAAKALLAIAYFRNAEEDKFWARVTDLSANDATEFRDLLFKGVALSEAGSRSGLDALDSAYKKNPKSAIARLERSVARARFAMDSGDLNLARDAITDATEAGHLLRDSPLPIANEIYARMVAASIYRHSHDDAAAEEVLSPIETLLQSPATHHYQVRMNRWRQLTEAKRDDEALQILETMLATQETDFREGGYLAIYGVIDLWRRGRLQEAVELFARAGDTADECGWMKLFLDLESGDPDAVSRYISRLDSRFEKSGAHLIMDWCMLRLVDEREALDQVAEKWREFVEKFVIGDLKPSYDAIVAFQRNRNGPEFLRAFEGSRRWESLARFLIGIEMLATGQPDEAIKCFQACEDTHYAKFYLYYLSRGFRERLMQDRAWPNWLK